MKIGPAECQIILSMREEGAPWRVIGRRLSASPQNIRCAVNPAYAADARAKRDLYLRRVKERSESHETPQETDALKRLAEIPQDDNRSLTARLCGDPLPDDPRRHWR